jgi:glycosyltransferase involved in cell wall biosynthesis
VNGPMLEAPFVSVIVPTHGRCALLARLIASLLVQNWPAHRMEIIVVHNWTDDCTDRMIQNATCDASISLHYHRTSFSGPGPSRQFGAERARGSVLAFIDDDCVATPDWIAAGTRALMSGFGLVQGRTLPNPSQPRRLLDRTVIVTGPTPYFETCNIFYDAYMFHVLGGFPERFRERFYAEDTALGWETKGGGYKTGFAADALVYHEVFAISLRSWMLEPRRMRHWPFLARAYPALRRELVLGIFLSRLTATFDLFVVGVLGSALVHSAFALLTLPYLVLRFLDRGRLRRPHLLLARLIFGLPRAAILAGVLLASSVRARSLVI